MQDIEPWLVFSRRERIGTFSLAFLIIAITALIRFIPSTTEPIGKEDLQNYIAEMDSLFIQEKTFKKDTNKKTKTRARSFSNKAVNSQPKTVAIRDSLLVLNPNEASINDLIKIGIPEKVANTLGRFRAKGGKFFKKEDMLKIYGMSPELYDQLSAQLFVPQREKRKWVTYDKKQYDKGEEPKIIVEINAADKEELMSISGIGPYYADRIIRYREELGGYYSLDQLTELEKLSDSTYQKLKPSLRLETNIVTKDLNTASEKQIMFHPYFSKQQAKQILSHRDFNLKLRSWDELQNLLKITPKEVERIQAYFVIQ